MAKGSGFAVKTSIYATRIAGGLTKLETAQARAAIMEAVPKELRSLPSTRKADGTFPEPVFHSEAAKRRFLAQVGPCKLT